MDRCSYFIADKAIFGSYPTQEAVAQLEDEGVKYFVNLTCNDEKKIVPYITNQITITYPIPDRRVPNNWDSFAKFIIMVARIISKLDGNDKLYLHCKGGHGRAGVVVACLLCFLYKISPDDALIQTNKFHNDRPVMRDKWRHIGSPQNSMQKNFVRRFFEPLRMTNSREYTSCFLNSAYVRVKIEGIGEFHTAEAAFQALKNRYDKDYISKMKLVRNPSIARIFGSRVKHDWTDEIQVAKMRSVINAKFDLNSDIRRRLLQTGLRPLVYRSKSDCFWGDGGDGSGSNLLGILLEEYRNESSI